MQRKLAVTAIGRGVRTGGPIGRLSRSAAYRVSHTLAANGRPIIGGRLTSGSSVYLDVRDPAHRQILWTGETEPGTAAILRRIIQPGWEMVDVGANAGFYSLLCADLGARRVLAFEPNPRTAALLTRSANGSTVEVIQAACGDHPGTTSLYFSPDPAKAAFATIVVEAQWSDDWSAWNTVDVPLVTVDQTCAERCLTPALVKIDAEGAEADVLAGMVRLLEEQPPLFILCEVAAGWERPDPSPWIELLRDAGYRPSLVTDDGSLSEFFGPVERSTLNVLFARS